MQTSQNPIPSGNGPHTTATQALGARRLDGRVVIVTGGYAGIGLETTRVLSSAGATVVVPARSPDKARVALAGVPRVELEALDLFDPPSIDAFAARFLAAGRPLHLLVNNAGIMAAPLVRDSRGFDSQFATNHLGHFQLTARLWPALRKAGGARVVSLSSRGHARAPMDFDDPRFERRPYEKWAAYGQAKTANVLFAVALDAFGASSGVRAFAVHPGAIITELGRSMSEDEMAAAVENATQLMGGMKTIPEGAATSVWCATSEQLDGKGGVYCEDADIAELAPGDAPMARGVRPYAVDPELAARLWAKSEEWTGVAF